MAPGKPYRLHPLAWLEIEGGDEWYLQRSADASAGFIAAVSEAIDSICQAPQRYPKYLYGPVGLSFTASHFPLFIWIRPTL